MYILGLDFETTWTDPVNPRLARPTEVGAVLYDTEKKMPVRIFSSLVYDENDYPSSPQELVDLTGISDDMLEKYGVPPAEMLDILNSMMDEADHMLAHNGNEFDKVIYEEECDRWGKRVVNVNWIDTKTDVPYPDHIKTRKLTHLAADHGFANPFAHRALFDVLTMFKVCEEYEFDEIVALSKEPNCTVIANVSYHDRELAKKRGYYWDGENKKWKKQMKKKQVASEEKEAPFRVVVMED